MDKRIDKQPVVYDPKNTYEKMYYESWEYLRQVVSRVFKNSTIIKTTTGETFKSYTCNSNSGIYHDHSCFAVVKIKMKYQTILPKSLAEERGYVPCRQCLKKEHEERCREFFKCDLLPSYAPKK